MIPATILGLGKKVLQWWQNRLAELVPSAPVEPPEIAVDPQIRSWFIKWLEARRPLEVGKIKDRTILTTQEASAGMSAFTKEFQSKMTGEPFAGRWGTIRVGEFLSHADYCRHHRRPSRTDRRPA